MKVLCSQEVVSPHLCGVVPCQITAKASAPQVPWFVLCLWLKRGIRENMAYSKPIDFCEISCGSFRKPARNLIEIAQRKSQDRCFSDFLPKGRVLLCGIDFALLPLYASLHSFSTSCMGANMGDEDCIEIYDFNYDTLTIHYGCKEGKHGKCKIKILDNKTNFIIHQEVIDVSPGLRWWTNFDYCKSFIYDAVTVVFELEGTKMLEQQYWINTTPPHHVFVDFWCDQDLELYSYYEIFFENVYARYGVSLEENDIVVDIGSNQGAFLKYALSHNVSTIISCEPNPYCVDTIKKYYGHHANIQFNPYAIAEKNGKTLLQIGRHSDKTGGGKIVEAQANAPEYYADGKTIKVETITFKDFIHKNTIAYIDFLKVDCEGSEVFIFREENTGFFSTQVHKIALEFHNEQKDDIITFLRDAGYEVHVDHGENHLGMLYATNPHFTKGIVAYPPAKAQ